MLVTTGFTFYVLYVYKQWEKHFSGHRVQREHDLCPSHKEQPDVKHFRENKERVVNNSKYHENFDSCELLNDLQDFEATSANNKILRDRKKRLNKIGTRLSFINHDEKAQELDMDHVYISFPDFLLGFIFIGPFSYLLWKKGTIILSIRQFLVKRGLLKVKDFDIDALIGTLCLEQSQAIHYYVRTKPDSKLGNVAGFYFADFPYVDNNLDFQVADLFAVDIDLDTKKFVKAKLDDIHLTASQTLILLWYNTIAAQHVKLHSLANWGLNSSKSIEDSDPFL